VASRIKNRKETPSWTPPLVFTTVASLIFLSLYSYQASDPSLSSVPVEWQEPNNMLGYFGSWTSDLFLQGFGFSAWTWPILLATAVVRWLFHREESRAILGLRFWVFFSLFLSGACLGTNLIELDELAQAYPPQGLLGIFLYEFLVSWIGHVGIGALSLLISWVSFLVWWPELPSYILEKSMQAFDAIRFFIAEKATQAWESYKERRANRSSESKLYDDVNEKEIILRQSTEAETTPGKKTVDSNSHFIPAIRQKAEDKSAKATTKREAPLRPTQWHLPPLSLLEKAEKRDKNVNKNELLETAKKISSALKSFDIQGEITEISPGPVITLYEFQPAPGVRVQKIVSVTTDLAMALGVPSVRIVAPIPGKSVAGIEVPNDEKENIVLRDVYEATNSKAHTQKLPLVLGRDGEGRPICEDLSRMPHLLIGGATNMGKSVLVNSILSSLLCRFTPDELNLIIVDPKLVEFKIYEDIPHLILPIVNDAMDASQALKWAVSETRRRYLEMQKISARNLEAYNSKLEQHHAEGEHEDLECFPYLVIIVDELAELMLTAKKDVEQSIVRLSQLARAAGIHLIMATQRPSADVVTGLIKSNCPSRAALRVASATDSRIILDTSGAEQLLGQGDMFFTNSGPMGLRRMQGCFVSDEEVERVCNFWRDQGSPDYHEEILEENNLDELSADGNNDPLFKEVVNFAKEKGSLSTSLIQRRFQIGYTRAARIMEQLEEAGIVGEAAAAGKPRDVLI